MNQQLQNLIKDVYDGIKDGRIVRNGQLFTERELCEVFGVKRGVIQKALVALETLGLIEIRERQGILVKDDAGALLSDAMPFLQSHSPLAIHNQAFEARMILEPQAAYLAAQKCTPEKAMLLESEMTFLDELQADQTKDPNEKAELLYQHNVIFHNMLVEMTENAVMAELYRYISTLSRDIFSLLGRLPSGFRPYALWPELLIREHKAIGAAVTANRPQEARDAMYQHLVNSQARNSATIRKIN